MKITHVIESSGGSADFMLYLIKYLPHHHHQVIYSDRTFAGRFEYIKANYKNASFYYWENAQREIRLLKDLKAAISLYHILKELSSDAIHMHSSKAGFIGRLIGRLLGKQNIIYTPNGLAFLRTDVSFLKRRIYVMFEKIASHLAGKVISCSKSEAQELIDRGIDSSYINNGTEIFDHKPKTTEESITIVTTGRITVQKNPIFFNRIAQCFESFSFLKFVWIGGGELESVLTAKNIEVTGWIDRSLVLKSVSNADIYLSTASWEGLPFAVLEAMNLSKPLLLTKCIGNIDLVESNQNGFLYDTVEDAVERIRFLIENPELINSFGRNSHDFVKNKFNVLKMASLYERAYITCQQI